MADFNRSRSTFDGRQSMKARSLRFGNASLNAICPREGGTTGVMIRKFRIRIHVLDRARKGSHQRTHLHALLQHVHFAGSQVGGPWHGTRAPGRRQLPTTRGSTMCQERRTHYESWARIGPTPSACCRTRSMRFKARSILIPSQSARRSPAHSILCSSSNTARSSSNYRCNGRIDE